MDASDSERLARLEREMSVLRAEFAKLRDRVGAPQASARADEATRRTPEPPTSTAPGSPPPSPSKQPSFAAAPRPPKHSLEQWIGRYGTIAVATITVLVGVGIFLNWAIQHNLIGPELRVVLGYAGAAGLAMAGMRLRVRGTREFGNVLMAMALAVVHLVCWSAGPLLHVLPSSAALGIGLLASAILAEFALRHDEESLCAVGFGGAALAPFITADDSGNLIALAAYGLVVIALSTAALRDRQWRAARGVTIASLFVYVFVIATAHSPHTAWPGIVSRLGILFPLAVLAAIIPAAHARHRRLLIRCATAAVAMGGMMTNPRGGDPLSVILIVAATVIGIGALDLFRPDGVELQNEAEADPLSARRKAFIDGVGLPLGLFVAAVVATPGALSAQSAIVGAVWSVLAVVMSHRNRAESEGDMYATTAALTALWIVPAAIPESQVLWRTVGAVGVGLILLGLALRMGRRPLAAGGLASLAIASLWVLTFLSERPDFSYSPFGTWGSSVAVIVVGAWFAARLITRVSGFLPELAASTRRKLDVAVVSGGVATAFMWGRVELAGGWNLTTATALVIAYAAACGATMIWRGRTRRVKPLRVIGLLLTLLAAGQAMIEAFRVPNIAVRIAIFFTVSAFLIAVGYWYRGGRDDDADLSPASV